MLLSGGAREWGDLPPAARNVATVIKDLIGCDIDIISVGPENQQTVFV
ncbi:MAG: adenylosuccinate synthetase [Candidatus Aenigmarchaeota archaeon]|nr:adenylosuccinate synthetase [Candidatus Aenigmarchaeota archaeon]